MVNGNLEEVGSSDILGALGDTDEEMLRVVSTYTWIAAGGIGNATTVYSLGRGQAAKSVSVSRPGSTCLAYPGSEGSRQSLSLPTFPISSPRGLDDRNL